MSITITINNINDLTDTERAVLRLVAADPRMTVDASADTDLAWSSGHEFDVPTDYKSIGEALAATPAPVEPEEVYIAVPTPVTPTPSSAELDSAGLPWDKRIHASTRTKVTAGTWKYARGVADDYIVQVERELRAVQAIPVPTPVPHTAPSAVAPIVPLPPVPTAPTAALPMTFAQLVQHITPMLVSGKLTQSMLQQVVNTFSLPHLAALGARPDLVETVRAAIDAEVNHVAV